MNLGLMAFVCVINPWNMVLIDMMILYIYDMNLTIRYEMGASFLFWDLNGILLGHDYGIS